MTTPHQAREALLDRCVEIALVDEGSFLKIAETLTRMGLAVCKPGQPNTLYQTCYLLHRRGRYFVLHFRELMLLDGLVHKTFLTDDDIRRRNAIAAMLVDWGLCTLKCPPERVADRATSRDVRVISFAAKADWKLVPKYTIGRKKLARDEF